MTENEAAKIVVNCGYTVYTKLGPGLFEAPYKECLHFELEKQGLLVQREKPIHILYDTLEHKSAYKIDLLVENKLVVEVKSVDAFHPVHFQQILTYLKLGNFKLGLLMNFNSATYKSCVKRFVNGL